MAILDPAVLYQTCGPWVATETTAAVVAAESSGHPYAFHTPEGSYYAPDLATAVRFLAEALRRWPSVDIGLMQINSRWIARANIRPELLLDSCTNVRLGTSILAANYGAAARHSKTPLEALIRALSAYNSGSESRSLNYAYRVIVKPLDQRTASALRITLGTAEGNPTGRAVDPRTTPVFFPKQASSQ